MPEKLKERIMDSELTLEKALVGKDIKPEIKESLDIIDVDYLSFDGKIHRGQMVVRANLVPELKKIFTKLLAISFPINKMIPISEYDWDDISSMGDNNSSSFNYRKIAGTDKLSKHALGIAVDINPVQNPCIQDGVTEPGGAEYDLSKPGTINDDVIAIFASYGWRWGGHWNDLKDYHHFEKIE